MRPRPGQSLRLSVPALALVIILGALLGPVLCPDGLGAGTRAWAVDVHGDDARDSYTGVGGLILPPTVDAQARRDAAACADCRWVVSSPCDTPYGVAFLRCDSHVLACPPGAAERRAWMQHDDSPWADRGLLCVSSAGPTTRAMMGREVRGEFLQHLPELVPRLLPRTGIVAQLPVLFDSGQPSTPVEADFDVAGQRVHLKATARWEWMFGDGSGLAQDQGSPRSRGMGVQHVYRHVGEHEVNVRAEWSAEYTVAGLGPFEVPDPVRQEATVVARVGQARAALASGETGAALG